MAKFILKRLLYMIPVLLGVVLIVFSIIRMAPGDPVSAYLGNGYTQEQYDRVESELGLDQPFLIQFVNYVKGIVINQDLGVSYQTKRSVTTEIMSRLPDTLKLAFIGCVITIVVGIPFGIISATKQYSVADYSVTMISLVFASMPGFWLGLMLIIIFSLKLGILPASFSTINRTWQHWVLPALAVGLSPVASITRLTRSSMLDVVRQDYVRTARAKGLAEWTIIRKHALRNALIPVITTLGLQLGMLVAGSVVVEAIFSIPGLGTLMTSAIGNADYPVIQGVVVVMAAFVCVINLFTDLAYGFADPRIMSQYTAGAKKKKKKAGREAAS